MKALYLRSDRRSRSVAPARPTTSPRRTLKTLLRHPARPNREWCDALALFEVLGEVQRQPSNTWMVEVAGERHHLHPPHDKDLTGPELIELRKLLQRAGESAEGKARAFAETEKLPPTLLVAFNHDEARIYCIGADAHDITRQEITPYGTHHFLHRPTHKQLVHQRGQHTLADSSFYVLIAATLVTGGRIVVVGHAAGHSNAADHLIEHLRSHNPETYARVVGEVRADLSRITAPQLLEIGQQVLR